MASSGIDYAVFNKEIIDEFRANKGVVGGAFEGSLIALITTKGARSGKDRVSPLVYAWDGDRMFIAATYAGSDRNPAWYHNLVAPRISRSRSGPTPLRLSPCRSPVKSGTGCSR
jgi:hypothetical protein